MLNDSLRDNKTTNLIDYNVEYSRVKGINIDFRGQSQAEMK